MFFVETKDLLALSKSDGDFKSMSSDYCYAIRGTVGVLSTRANKSCTDLELYLVIIFFFEAALILTC